MNRLLQFVSQYGAFFVLLLLCAYYSLVTWNVQHPSDPRAGRRLAGRGMSTARDQHPAAVANRETALPRPREISDAVRILTAVRDEVVNQPM